ncbi:hypothetical protein CYMTET_15865 [Cymbomonas tetramitiformis]|uniref:Uncharacterized protein n=1 Tax=Cymbomonas tetramitiformis TaxID=36881 RepID=A0AAE0GEM6_9CHLO|nr:hypothetical protein CYMTET_15865 [Cymbomonas tetramitiformis]
MDKYPLLAAHWATAFRSWLPIGRQPSAPGFQWGDSLRIARMGGNRAAMVRVGDRRNEAGGAVRAGGASWAVSRLLREASRSRQRIPALKLAALTGVCQPVHLAGRLARLTLRELGDTRRRSEGTELACGRVRQPPGHFGTLLWAQHPSVDSYVLVQWAHSFEGCASMGEVTAVASSAEVQ